MKHAFNTNVAKLYDVSIATLLDNFVFWTLQNLANKNNIHDGLCWTYNTVQAFCDIFPYWTRHQIEHLLIKCEKAGLLVSGNYNSHKYDRKKWYALTSKCYILYPELAQEHYIPLLWDSISEKSELSKLHPYISEKSELSLGKFREAFLGIPKPIADINTDEKPDSNIGDSEESENDQKNTHQKEVKNKKTNFNAKELMTDNPHEIPELMLDDWLEVRKSKKNKVTATAWNRVNKVLFDIKKQLGIEPIEAFETMVASGWQSLDIKYFQKESKGSTGSSSQGSGIKDYYGNDITWDE